MLSTTSLTIVDVEILMSESVMTWVGVEVGGVETGGTDRVEIGTAEGVVEAAGVGWAACGLPSGPLARFDACKTEVSGCDADCERLCEPVAPFATSPGDGKEEEFADVVGTGPSRSWSCLNPAFKHG